MLNLKNDITELKKGKIDYIHFDVMDGIFVPRYGLHPEILQEMRTLTKIPVDVHMMVINVEPYIGIFAQAQANIFTFHAESHLHADRTIKLIKKSGMKAGIALNPATPLSVLDYILDDIDLILLMAINPGIVGHKLIPGMMEKIKHLKQKIKNHPNIIIEIDGGVTPESAPLMIENGANMLVCGSSTIFKPPTAINIKIKELHKSIKNSR
jgi:ribulose-phosphate 3-epimerase